MKKVLLTLATLLLVSGGAWAVDIVNDGVTYNMTQSGSPTVVNGTPILRNSSPSLSNAILGQITFTSNYSQVNTTTTNYVGYPTSATTNSISLASWNESSQDSYSVPVSVDYDYNDAEYATLMADLASKNSDILKITPSMTQVVYDGDSYTYIEVIDAIPTAVNAYVYKVASALKTKYYVITKIFDNSNTTVTNNITNKYTVTSLPASFLTPSVTSLTISGSITTIANDAFASVSSSLTQITASGNFGVNNNMLMNSDNTVIYYVLPGANNSTISLPRTVTEIKPNALKNCTGVTINSDHAVTVGANQGSNVINQPDATLTKVAAANGGFTVNGKVTNSNIAALAKSGTYIDFRSATILEDLNITNNANNCLLIFANTSKNITGTKNIVVGGNCANLVITDRQDFYSPVAFTAESAVYSRSFGGQWSTLTLPFTVAASAFGAQAFTLSNYNSTTDVLTFTPAATVGAGVPHLVKSSATQINTSSVRVEAGSPSSTVSGTATFFGNYTRKDITTEPNIYGITGAGKFAHAVNGASFPAFRAYFTIGSGAASPEARFVDEDGIEIENNTSDIEGIEAAKEISIYTMDGKKMNASESLAPGSYIMNGKKIQIK